MPLRPRSRPSGHPRCPSPGSTQDPARRGQQGRDPCQHPGIALQMVAGGRWSLTSCPWGQRSLSPFPADFISYQVTCGIASSLATSSILRGKRISRPFLLIAEEHIRVYKGRTLCRKQQPKPGQGRAVRSVPTGKVCSSRANTAPGCGLLLPPERRASQLHAQFQTLSFLREERSYLAALCMGTLHRDAANVSHRP